MLAEKLLTKTDYDCEREIRTLELLKLRFGDANLHNCEVRLCCPRLVATNTQGHSDTWRNPCTMLVR